jgi:hypothetical protein
MPSAIASSGHASKGIGLDGRRRCMARHYDTRSVSFRQGGRRSVCRIRVGWGMHSACICVAAHSERPAWTMIGPSGEDVGAHGVGGQGAGRGRPSAPRRPALSAEYPRSRDQGPGRQWHHTRYPWCGDPPLRPSRSADRRALCLPHARP